MLGFVGLTRNFWWKNLFISTQSSFKKCTEIHYNSWNWRKVNFCGFCSQILLKNSLHATTKIEKVLKLINKNGIGKWFLWVLCAIHVETNRFIPPHCSKKVLKLINTVEIGGMLSFVGFTRNFWWKNPFISTQSSFERCTEIDYHSRNWRKVDFCGFCSQFLLKKSLHATTKFEKVLKLVYKN